MSPVLRASTAVVSLVTLAALTARPVAQVVVSEVVAANRHGLRDQEGLTADWVELHNCGQLAEPMAGRILADDKGARFVFPEVEIGPRGYLVVYLTGKQRHDPTRRLHTGFLLGRGGGTLRLLERDGSTELSSIVFGKQHDDIACGYAQPSQLQILVDRCQQARFWIPTGNLPAEWTTPGFNDTPWSTGFGGFGYANSAAQGIREWIGTDIGAAMRTDKTNAYFRYHFETENPGQLSALMLRVHCVGGFIAWLNGAEIARLNVPDTVLPDSKALTWREGADLRLVHEFEAPRPDLLLRAGKNVLALQSFSTSIHAFDHLIMAELSGYVPGALQPDQVVYFATPSPGRPNGAGLPAVAKPPKLTPDSTMAAAPTSFAVTKAGKGIVRFTTDGTAPSHGSPVLDAAVQLDHNAKLQVRRFVDGELPSPTASVHFTRLADELRDYQSDLPMLVISTHGVPVETKQWIDAHVVAIDLGTEGSCRLADPAQVSSHGSVRLRGSSTLNLPKRSYAIELHQPDGDNLEVPLLGMSAAAEWVLYAPHNYDQSHLRNALCYELARRMGIAAPRWRFCELFVDTDGGSVTTADYKGLYLLVETIAVGADRVDIDPVGPTDNEPPAVTGGYILKIDRPGLGERGFDAGGQQLQFVSPSERKITDPQRAFLQQWFGEFGTVLSSPEFADPERGYPTLLDVDSFIDYHLLHEYGKNPDAYTLSTYMHLPRGGKLRMGPIWDFDRAMRTNDAEYWVGRGGQPKGWTGDYQHGWWGVLFKDPAFAARYRQRGRNWLENELAPAKVRQLVREIAATIANAEERDRARWPIIAAGAWHDELADLENWIEQRTAWMRSELLELPFLVNETGPLELPFTMSMRHANATGVMYYTTDGADPMLEDGRVSPNAKIYERPLDLVEDVQVRARVLVDGIWSPITERSFVRSVPTLAVSEIMYNPEQGHRAEFVEFVNYGDAPIDMTGIDVDGAIRYHFGTGPLKTLGPGERTLIVNDLETFLERYDAVGVNIAGEFLGMLSNTEATFTVTGRVGERVARVGYTDSWYPETDGRGRSLVLRAPKRRAEAQEDWRASDEMGGTPGR